MVNIDNIKERCDSITNETIRGAITPVRLGTLLKDMAECIEQAHVSDEITDMLTI